MKQVSTARRRQRSQKDFKSAFLLKNWGFLTCSSCQKSTKVARTPKNPLVRKGNEVGVYGQRAAVFPKNIKVRIATRNFLGLTCRSCQKIIQRIMSPKKSPSEKRKGSNSIARGHQRPNKHLSQGCHQKKLVLTCRSCQKSYRRLGAPKNPLVRKGDEVSVYGHRTPGGAKNKIKSPKSSRAAEASCMAHY